MAGGDEPATLPTSATASSLSSMDDVAGESADESADESAVAIAMRIFRERCVDVTNSVIDSSAVDRVTFNLLMQACLHSGRAEMALRVRQQAETSGMPLPPQGEELLVRGLMANGKPGEAYRIYDELQRRHGTPSLALLDALTEGCYAACELAADADEKAIWMERSLRLFEDGQEMIARRRLLGGHPQETAASVPPYARRELEVRQSWEHQPLDREARRRREESVLGNMYERETMQLPPSWRERRRRPQRDAVSSMEQTMEEEEWALGSHGGGGGGGRKGKRPCPPSHRSSLRRVQRAGLASEMDARHGGDGGANPRPPVTYDDFDDEIASFYDEHHRSSAKAVRNKAAAVAARSAARAAAQRRRARR